MRKTLSILCLFVLGDSLYAQTVRTPSIMRYAGMGTYSSRFKDVFSIENNQASLCGLTGVQAGVYTERRFMLKELSLVMGAIGIPLKKGNGMGISVRRFGASSYNEMQVGWAYGKKLGSKVDIGVQFNYNKVSVAGYEGASVLNAEIGSIWHFTDRLHGGVHLYNISGSKYGKANSQKIPAVFTTGLGYECSEFFFLSAEIAKEEGQPVNVNAGFHYTFYQQFFMRFGVTTGVGNSVGGVGFKWDSYRLDISVSYHPQLGVTPGLLFIFSPIKETKH